MKPSLNLLALATICLAYSLNSGVAACLKVVAIAAIAFSCGPPKTIHQQINKWLNLMISFTLQPRKYCLINFVFQIESVLSVENYSSPGAPQTLMSSCSNYITVLKWTGGDT